jgi:hypothetical protein
VSQAVAILSAVIAFLSAATSAWLASRLALQTTALERARTAEEHARKYREPLLIAAFDLQSRLYNVLDQRFLEVFYVAGRPKDREYSIENTLYLIGQYFAWSEILRREVQFLSPGDLRREDVAIQALRRVSVAFSSTVGNSDPTFRVFRGEQRALGEIMISRRESNMPNSPAWDCRGYAEFVKLRADEDTEVSRWFNPLADDLRLLATHGLARARRLVTVQHTLIELISNLDPRHERVDRLQLTQARDIQSG